MGLKSARNNWRESRDDPGIVRGYSGYGQHPQILFSEVGTFFNRTPSEPGFSLDPSSTVEFNQLVSDLNSGELLNIRLSVGGFGSGVSDEARLAMGNEIRTRLIESGVSKELISVELSDFDPYPTTISYYADRPSHPPQIELGDEIE